MNKRVYKQVKKQFKKGIMGHNVSSLKIEEYKNGFYKQYNIEVTKNTIKRFLNYVYTVEVVIPQLEKGILNIFN